MPNNPKENANAAPLKATSKEPQRDESVQDAANESVEQNRGTRFGDNTSSTGEQNQRGLHGRDGGVTAAPEGGGVHNPAPDKAAVEGQRDKKE